VGFLVLIGLLFDFFLFIFNLELVAWQKVMAAYWWLGLWLCHLQAACQENCDQLPCQSLYHIFAFISDLVW